MDQSPRPMGAVQRLITHERRFGKKNRNRKYEAICAFKNGAVTLVPISSLFVTCSKIFSCINFAAEEAIDESVRSMLQEMKLAPPQCKISFYPIRKPRDLALHNDWFFVTRGEVNRI